jgi:hypothetical protein
MYKAVGAASGILAAVLVASQRRDIVRYLRIKQMSLGRGHPENVPAGGRKAYPQSPNPRPASGH